MTPPWASVAELADEAQLGAFECTRESVQEWLFTKALASRQFVRTRLYLDEAAQPLGFIATTTIIVLVEGGSSAQRAGSRDGQSVGFLLAQMGVRRDLEGRGIGKHLVRESMRSAVAAHSEAPFPLFVVDAADDGLVTYYSSMGLKPLNNTLRLVAPMSTIMKAMHKGW